MFTNPKIIHFFFEYTCWNPQNIVLFSNKKQNKCSTQYLHVPLSLHVDEINMTDSLLFSKQFSWVLSINMFQWMNID